MAILLIDSYDSFTYNLRSLIETSTGEKVITIHNDSIPYTSLLEFLPYFKAIIVGPGPGHPSIASDVGLIPYLFDGSLEVDIPILGICLGFQSLCLSQGCDVSRLDLIKHGQVYPVNHFSEHELFKGVPQGFESVRYHSLYVPELNDKLVKLASTVEEHNHKEIIMGVGHVDKPWFGVQYHPESICSFFGGQLVKNFMSLANEYNGKLRHIKAYDDVLLKGLCKKTEIPKLITNEVREAPQFFKFKEIDNGKKAIEICDLLNSKESEFVLLNSASFPGDWSIIGLPSASTSVYISHSTDSPDTVTIKKNSVTTQVSLNGGNIWSYISEFISDKLSKNLDTEQGFPFIGGLLGMFSYEEGEFIHVSNLPKLTSSEIPDTKLVYVEDCILIDHSTEKTYITTLNPETDIEIISQLVQSEHTLINSRLSIPTTKIVKPTYEEYTAQFSKCQEYLSNGDSYELCLTSSTEIHIPNNVTSWEIYKTLTLKNPSPYSAFFKFKDCCLISSSPERFVKWDDKHCELRPIKGTVRKTPEMDFNKASAILNTAKEIGENLMIVDLIRHDLYSFLSRVEVQKLMQVEEYTTVYQLVSVIQGQFEKNGYQGIDILSKSLPPGSMTGAPKKRSVELLQQLENRRRGLYSGVCGYWSVDNHSDWSVIIRSLYHYVDDVQNDDSVSVWRIGAGGAITVLSDLQGEWEELLTKLDSALQIFRLN
ncbi:hypothetical protein WICPIJ_001186 [Wickerhamomyces pijperi]|uniref:aminodeoxychorismate synthase n=1 Tax=Wickerhamomyces pijperi TaxID=599730 RepID=A0A9P8TQU7_WICPI|nr:hypothetical protein WICPIJ_001186 [Wickerhamomyces pijperi]